MTPGTGWDTSAFCVIPSGVVDRFNYGVYDSYGKNRRTWVDPPIYSVRRHLVTSSETSSYTVVPTGEKISPVTDFFESNYNYCAWYVRSGGDASFDNRSDGVARSYGRKLSGHCYKSRCIYYYNDGRR